VLSCIKEVACKNAPLEARLRGEITDHHSLRQGFWRRAEQVGSDSLPPFFHPHKRGRVGLPNFRESSCTGTVFSRTLFLPGGDGFAAWWFAPLVRALSRGT